ncbi:hypothetical protein AX16_008800 [Volvariella volvacea WC 439]|nr:hypothetical protein AX16_008800 [Volvariella volvacea WC 439]
MSDGPNQKRSTVRRKGIRTESEVQNQAQNDDGARKGSVKITYGGRGTQPKKQSRAEPRQKAPHSESKIGIMDSPSHPASKRQQPRTRAPNSTPATKTLKRQRAEAHDSQSESSSEYSSRPSSKRRLASSSKRSFSVSPKRKDIHATSRDPYVWVLLDRHARVHRSRQPTSTADRVWWPAEVIHGDPNHSTTVTLRLFGSVLPPATSPSKSKLQEIVVDSPCPNNILSMHDSDGRLRFKDMPLLTNGPPPATVDIDSSPPSPRKKPKLEKDDLEGRWKAAVGMMIEAKEADSDDLPDAQSAFAFILPSSQSTGNASSQNISQRGDDDMSLDDPRVDSDLDSLELTDLDDSLTIPGELVLARESKTSPFWPAKILSCIRPQKRGEKPKYKIVYLDGTEGIIPRDWFYSSDASEFATCKLGVWQSGFDDVSNDKDDDKEPIVDASYRPSPTPDEVPPTGEQFFKLDVQRQFVYTKPVLSAILNHQYAPAKARHEDFMAGGFRRQNLSKQAGLRGIMDPKHVEQLQGYLLEWCLRGERLGQALFSGSREEDSTLGASEDQDMTQGLTTLEAESTEAPTTAGTLKSISPALTEELSALSSSPAPIPPNSSFITTISPAEPLKSIEEPPAAQKPAQSGGSDSIAVLTEATISTQALTVDLGDFDETKSDLSDLTSLEREGDETITDPPPPPRPPRQRGCEAYEALTAGERLKVEAVIQILLWRAGLRTHPGLLSEDEEQSLHDKGVELSKETDWVYDIMRLRESRIRQLEAKKKATQSRLRASSWLGQARPKRSTTSVVDYRE